MVPAPAAASVYGQLRFRLSGSEALCCKSMHLTRADASAHWPDAPLQPRTLARCSKTQWVVICTWAACSSLNGLQYYARTSAHTSTCGQSDSLVSGIRSHVKNGHGVCPFAVSKCTAARVVCLRLKLGTATPTVSLRRASGGFSPSDTERDSRCDCCRDVGRRLCTSYVTFTVRPIIFGRMIWAECRSCALRPKVLGAETPTPSTIYRLTDHMVAVV